MSSLLSYRVLPTAIALRLVANRVVSLLGMRGRGDDFENADVVTMLGSGGQAMLPVDSALVSRWRDYEMKDRRCRIDGSLNFAAQQVV